MTGQRQPIAERGHAATRWLGPVRMDLDYEGADGARHAYAVTATPSVGGRWRYIGLFDAAPDDASFDQVAAQVASAVVLGSIVLPDTFGAEQTYIDLVDLIEAGLADASRWPVRREENAAAAVLKDVTEGPGRAAPMHTLSFELHPATEQDGARCADVLENLRRSGMHLEFAREFCGVIPCANPEDLGEVVADMLGSSRFTGLAVIGANRWEYRDGECRADGWEAMTHQLEITLHLGDGEVAPRVVSVLSDLSRRHDVADMDVDASEGLFHVLASVQEPMAFLDAVREALGRGGFRGHAELAGAGIWRFGGAHPVRVDQCMAM